MYENNGYTNDYQPQGYYEKPAGGKRGAGGYIITALIAFIVGVMVASVFFIYFKDAGDTGLALLPTPSAGVQPEATPDTSEEAGQTQAPELTPTPTERVMPELDGTAPVIGDSSNPIPDIVEQISPGVVGITNYAYSYEYARDVEASTGSGFIISTEGYILTNAHVVEGASKVTINFTDGEEIEAELVGYDKTSDIAVLKIEKAGLTVLKLGDSDTVRVGEFVIAIGDPTGRELAGTTTFGIISATAREVNIDGVSNEYLQADAAVNPGNSGGPLLNMAGEVVGVTSAKTVTASYDEYGNAIAAEGLGFALPINYAMDIVEQLITNGNIQRPGIGISVITIDELSAEQYGVPQGILVYTVTKDGPGDKAGLEPNDIIVECNGAALTDQDQFVAMVKAYGVGDTLELKVWRSGSYMNVELTLADLNTLGSELIGGEADFEFFD